MSKHYAALEARLKRIHDIQGAAAILSWDAQVMMPSGAVGDRGEQLATLSGLAHELLVAPATGEAIQGARAEDDLDGWQAANLREAERRYRRATALDPALVEALTRAETVTEMTWREARAKADFKLLQPQLEEMVRLTRESGRQIGSALGLSPYDALLDGFQPDLRDHELEPIFARLAAELPPIVEQVVAHQATPERPHGPFPPAQQKQLGRELMERLGFDFSHGRLDESVHPFCGGTPADVRMTTRYREDEVVSAIMGILHETGHALYERGLPAAYQAQPVGAARGMAVHESQSLLVEMQAARSPHFVGFLSARMATMFGDQPALAPDNVRQLYTHVARSLIRVDADEVTYPLHIILRHRLERDMVTGDLEVADLPVAWDEGMAELLGVTPPDDSQGCLQDIHWPAGAFGYFPCYTLGALLAAQLFQTAREANPGIMEELAEGSMLTLVDWLRRNVHEQGSRLPWNELVRQATGAPLTADAFLAHLRARYLH